MPWNPAAARDRLNLTFSPDDRAKAEARMAPLARDAGGLFGADAVFEGGGVLGTAFLGAARVCADLGVRWHAVAGSSAGAITAALLATDLRIEQIEQAVGELDYLDLLGDKTSRLIFNGDPADDLDNPILLLTNLALLRKTGQYGTDRLRKWVEDTLGWDQKRTFADIERVPDRKLKLVVSDLTRGEMLVLPDDLGPPTRQAAFPIAEAVRLSMSIPFFFTPGSLDFPGGGTSTIVDGGILSNFPLWVFDAAPGNAPRWPTFGFRLVDRSPAATPRIDGVTDLFSAMLRTMMLASDRRYLTRMNLGRVIDIDLTGLNITATQFGLTDVQKDQLYERGYRATKEFFTKTWDWKAHLKLRGF
jgi:NTE family protein